MSKETWMAPGNGKIFDSELKNESKMNKRTIGVLEYIDKKSSENGYVEKIVFEREIKDFLYRRHGLEKNKSTEGHFFRTSLFYGFIEINKKQFLRLTIEGKIFLDKYKDNNFSEALKYFINQLDNVTYPNKGASDTQGLYLYPFRIIFKLLLDNNGLEIEFVKSKLINIKKYDDIKKYIESGNIDDIKSMSHEKYTNREKKYHTWVLNSLKNIGILCANKKKYSLSCHSKNQVKLLFSKINYKDMFFEKKNNLSLINENIADKRYKRNYKIIEDAKKRDNNICIRNNKHITFMSSDRWYTEGHHLLPFHQQKNFDFNVDDVDNIVSLCANCHREIHFSDNKDKIINKLYDERKVFFDKNNLGIDILYKVYNL